jgi:hypothetical protein
MVFTHRVYRVPGFLASRPNWLLPPPHPLVGVVPPLVPGGGGEDTLARGRGGGGSHSDEGTDTLVLYGVQV